jgi:murein DD-endopeptidase MepM/ murein hydrolase activator NlpD
MGNDRSTRHRLGWHTTIVPVLVLSACTAVTDSSENAAPVTPAPTFGTTTTTTVAPTITDAPGTTTTRISAADRCLSRAEFGDPAESPYVLPFSPGDGYTILQSYCSDDGSHETQLAYDFAMPLGSTVVASREGVVLDVKEDVLDDQNTRFLNHVLIEHADGTVAFYAHFQHHGALVEVGDEVAQGQEIGLSGATGRTGGPVLHFGVYATDRIIEGSDVPVVFSNTEGPLDQLGGPRQWSFYEALPYEADA